MPKRIIFIFAMIIMAFPLTIQATSQATRNTKQQKHTPTAFEEFAALYAMKSKTDITPSLKLLIDKIGQADSLDADTYFCSTFTLFAIYKDKGDTYSAKTLMDNAIKVMKRKNGDRNPKYLLQLINANAILKSSLKNYQEALNDYNEVLAIHEKFGIYDISYVYTLQNISIAHQNLGDIKASKKYMDMAVEAYEKQNGSLLDTSAPDVMTLVANYAMTYYLSGDRETAERYFRHVISNTPTSERAWQLAASNLATIQTDMGRYDESLTTLAAMKKAGYGNQSVFLHTQTIDYAAKDDSANATASLAEYNNTLKEKAVSAFSQFNRTECENNWTDVSKRLTFFNNWIAAKFATPTTAVMAYDNLLFTKTLLLGVDMLINKSVRQSGDASLRQLLDDCRRDRATAIYKMLPEEKNQELITRIAAREDSLVHSIKNVAETLGSMAGTWQDVQRMLDKDEAAIEFTYIPTNLNIVRQDCDTHYGAFVITKECKAPRLVVLGQTEEVDSLMPTSESDQLTINRFYKPANMRRLYDMLWRDIEPLVKKKHTLYYTTSRLLANLNFDILTDQRGRRLAQRHRMWRLSSTNMIAKVKSDSKMPYRTAALFGDVTYSETAEEMQANAQKHNATTKDTALQRLRGEWLRGLFGKIPATAAEVDSIKQALSSSGVAVATYRQGNANEEAVKRLDGNAPDILHFATHGYVINTTEKADNYKLYVFPLNWETKDVWMVLSGLLLAGANNAWNGGKTPDDMEDGVLTADEIANLDLSDTRLVVLSACETACGSIDQIDGVFGLQRAFKKAGAGSIVMSLWQVDDDATCLLMTAFYQSLAKGMERHDALREAIAQVQRVYNDPYYWAGFIMLD